MATIDTKTALGDYKDASNTLDEYLQGLTFAQSRCDNVIQNPSVEASRKVAFSDGFYNHEKHPAELNALLISCGFQPAPGQNGLVLYPSADAWEHLKASKTAIDEAIVAARNAGPGAFDDERGHAINVEEISPAYAGPTAPINVGGPGSSRMDLAPERRAPGARAGGARGGTGIGCNCCAGLPQIGQVLREEVFKWPQGHPVPAISRPLPPNPGVGDYCTTCCCSPYAKAQKLTTFLIVVNIIMMIITFIYADAEYDEAFDGDNSSLGPGAEALRSMGGKWEPWIRDGQVYRLITPIFLHAGFFHLLTNTLFLNFFGWIAETRWSWQRTFVIYILAGFGGNTLSCLGSPDSVGVGASGSLFGVLGATMSWLLYHKETVVTAKRELCIMTVIIVINLIFGATSTGIDNFAHLGGLLTGLLLGASIPHPHQARASEKKIRYTCGALAFVYLVLTFGMIWNNDDDDN